MILSIVYNLCQRPEVLMASIFLAAVLQAAKFAKQVLAAAITNEYRDDDWMTTSAFVLFVLVLAFIHVRNQITSTTRHEEEKRLVRERLEHENSTLKVEKDGLITKLATLIDEKMQHHRTSENKIKQSEDEIRKMKAQHAQDRKEKGILRCHISNLEKKQAGVTRRGSRAGRSSTHLLHRDSSS